MLPPGILSSHCLLVTDDAKLQQSGIKNVSPIVSINGTEVAEFLASYASGQSLQDRDAQYVLRSDEAVLCFLLTLSGTTESSQL